MQAAEMYQLSKDFRFGARIARAELSPQEFNEWMLLTARMVQRLGEVGPRWYVIYRRLTWLFRLRRPIVFVQPLRVAVQEFT